MSQSENLGPNERVKTDERQWIMQDMVISRREFTFRFDLALQGSATRLTVSLTRSAGREV